MNPEQVGLLALIGLVVLVLLRVPVAVSLMMVALLGNLFFLGGEATIAQLQLIIWDVTGSFILITLPLFILMGQLAHNFGLGRDLFICFSRWFGHLPGGLAVTAIASSASFGSISGSSVATVASVGKMLMPELKRYRYDDSLAAGSIAAAGVIAILIPPSVPLVFYSAWTETSLADLFIAGMVPGVVLAVLYCLYVFVRCVLSPDQGPTSEKVSWRKRGAALIYLLPLLGVLIVVLGSIYLGIATPTEAAAVGVAGVLVLGVLKKRVSKGRVKNSFEQTILLSCNILFLFIAGLFFSRFLVHTHITATLIETIGALQVAPIFILLLLVVMYLVLGAILDTFGMIILTLPFVYPLVTSLGMDAVWFGIFIVMMIELALITPPIGLNVFMMHKLDQRIRITKIYRGTAPFVLLTLVTVVALIVFPEMALWLPALVKQ